MKISEINDTFESLLDEVGNVQVLGISIIDSKIVICYQDRFNDIKKYSTDCKNCDL